MYSHMGCRLVIFAVWQPLITFFLHCMEMSSTNIRQNLFFSVLWMILSHTGLKQHQGEYMMTGCSFLDETWNMIWWPKTPHNRTKKKKIASKIPKCRDLQDHYSDPSKTRQLMCFVSSWWFWVDEDEVKSSHVLPSTEKGFWGEAGARDDGWEFAMHRSYIHVMIYTEVETHKQTQQERVYLSTTTGRSTNTAKPGIDRWKWLGQAAIWMARGGKGYYK